MKPILKFLANPYLTGFVGFLCGIPFISKDLMPYEYIFALPLTLAIYGIPLVLISLFTRDRLKKDELVVNLTGLWVGAVISAAGWTAYILSIDDGQAGLGMIYTPTATIAGGAAGYALGGLYSRLTGRSN